MKRTTLAALACTAVTLSATAVHAGEIDPGLAHVLAMADEGEVVSSLVFLLDQGDVEELKAELDAERAPFARRNEEVVRLLQDTAAITQRALLEELALLKDTGDVESFEPFWIANVIRVDAPGHVLHQLAERPDVLRIYYNIGIESVAPIANEPERDRPVAEPPAQDGGIAGGNPEAGLVAIRVPEVWASGFTGAGVLVASLDTGVAGNHPAVGSRWRGHDPQYAGNPEWAWFDPVTNTTSPQEFHGTSHGTHTMGTIVGGAPGDQIGVAPGAQWVHAAVIDRVNIATTIADAIAAFQWIAAPTGKAGDAWAVPRITSNSWGTVASHGHPTCDQTFWVWIDNSEAAGTTQFFAAGNEAGGGLRRPADRALDEYRSSAVAAVNANNPSWPLASFSSKGPTMCTENGSPAIKPDIAAPGVGVRSALANGGYGVKDGTSMAVPHLNGVAALMLEACDVLTADDVKQIIYDTAHNLGDPGKDNSFGWGMVDAMEAVNMAIAQCTIGVKLPNGAPKMLDPGFPKSFQVEVLEGSESVVPGSEKLFYRFDGGEFQSVSLVPLGDLLYEATLPSPMCGDVAEFYVQIEGDGGSVRTIPNQAPNTTFTALVGEFVTTLYHRDNFAKGMPSGWTMNGLWHVASACPTSSGACPAGNQWAYYGQSSTCNFATAGANKGQMNSAPIAFPSVAPGDKVTLSFCYALQTENNSSYDIAEFVIVNTDVKQRMAEAPTWSNFSMDVTPWAGQTHTLRWQFDTVDGVLNNFKGWQVDQLVIEVTSLECENPTTMPGDLNGDGSIGVPDLLILLSNWGPCPDDPETCPADIDGNGSVGVSDLLILLANWN